MIDYPDLPENMTPGTARSWFLDRGMTVTEWAAARGFRRENVYAALAGRTHGTRGLAYEVALALGLKRRLPERQRTEPNGPKGGGLSISGA